MSVLRGWKIVLLRTHSRCIRHVHYNEHSNVWKSLYFCRHVMKVMLWQTNCVNLFFKNSYCQLIRSQMWFAIYEVTSSTVIWALDHYISKLARQNFSVRISFCTELYHLLYFKFVQRRQRQFLRSFLKILTQLFVK